MTDLIIKVEAKETITTMYSYSFIDRKGLKVEVENIPNHKELLRNIKAKTKGLKDYNIKIIENK